MGLGRGGPKDPVPTQTTTCLHSEFSFSLLKDFQRKTLPPIPRWGKERLASWNQDRLLRQSSSRWGVGGARGCTRSGRPRRGKGLCHLGVSRSTPTLPGWLVSFSPFRLLLPFKAVTPRRVERKPWLLDQTISQDRSISAPLLPRAADQGLWFSRDQPPPPKKH